MTTRQKTTSATALDRKPRDEELDVYGLTHVGKVRAVNQDHFLICSLSKHLQVHLTSLPEVGRLPVGAERLAFLAMVADGVGGGVKGEEASRIAVEAVTQYVTRTMHCYFAADQTDEQDFSPALEAAALQCHADIVGQAEENPDRRGMATTLTLWLGVWPRAYLLQVGDSRCYLLRDGELTQISRDQTMAQELIDQGILTRTDASTMKWSNVLSSSIGGGQTAPVVTRLD